MCKEQKARQELVTHHEGTHLIRVRESQLGGSHACGSQGQRVPSESRRPAVATGCTACSGPAADSAR